MGLINLLERSNDPRVWNWVVGFAPDAPREVTLGDVLHRGATIRHRRRLTDEDWRTLAAAYLRSGIDDYGERWLCYSFEGRTVHYPEALANVTAGTGVCDKIIASYRRNVEQLLADAQARLGRTIEAPVG
jgi:hypothetical protein